MKYLLILLFTINTSFAMCNTQSIVNVNSCTVNDRLYNLIQVVRPEAIQVTKEAFIEDSLGKYYFEIDELKTPYENLVIDPVLPLIDLQNELTIWKVARIAEVQLRLDKLAYRARLDVFPRYILFPSILQGTGRGHDLYNYMKELVKNLDYVKLEEIEAASINVQAEKDAKIAGDLAEKNERAFLRSKILLFKNGNATNVQIQRAIAYILQRL